MPKRSLLLLPGLLLSSTLISFAQLKITTLDKKDIPATIKYAGHIINAVRYTDVAGDHLVLTAETGLTPSKDKEIDGRDAALYAYHYKVTGNDFKLTWQTYDFIKDCPVDLAARYLPNTFAITDLNKDGKAEVWLMYVTVCHGDVSPSNMKIIMHEGDKKYAVRGENRVMATDKDFVGGKYTFDDAFKTGPEVFRQYAANLWKKNIMETWK
jgi:hypothetical protein